MRRDSVSFLVAFAAVALAFVVSTVVAQRAAREVGGLAAFVARDAAPGLASMAGAGDAPGRARPRARRQGGDRRDETQPRRAARRFQSAAHLPGGARAAQQPAGGHARVRRSRRARHRAARLRTPGGRKGDAGERHAPARRSGGGDRHATRRSRSDRGGRRGAPDRGSPPQVRSGRAADGRGLRGTRGGRRLAGASRLSPRAAHRAAAPGDAGGPR